MANLSMRERLLDAAWQIVSSEGFAGATTKNIAARAGAAEGSIYKHFADKSELIVALVLERAGDVRSIFARLRSMAGKGEINENLAHALADLIGFYENLQGLVAGVFLDTALLERMQAVTRDGRHGPQRAHLSIIDYLEVEQGLGRLELTAPSDIVAMLMVGAAHERAFLNRMTGTRMSRPERRAFARQVVGAVLARRQ